MHCELLLCQLLGNTASNQRLPVQHASSAAASGPDKQELCAWFNVRDWPWTHPQSISSELSFECKGAACACHQPAADVCSISRLITSSPLPIWLPEADTMITSALPYHGLQKLAQKVSIVGGQALNCASTWHSSQKPKRSLHLSAPPGLQELALKLKASGKVYKPKKRVKAKAVSGAGAPAGATGLAKAHRGVQNARPGSRPQDVGFEGKEETGTRPDKPPQVRLGHPAP